MINLKLLLILFSFVLFTKNDPAFAQRQPRVQKAACSEKWLDKSATIESRHGSQIIISREITAQAVASSVKHYLGFEIHSFIWGNERQLLACNNSVWTLLASEVKASFDISDNLGLVTNYHRLIVNDMNGKQVGIKEKINTACDSPACREESLDFYNISFEGFNAQLFNEWGECFVCHEGADKVFGRETLMIGGKEEYEYHHASSPSSAFDFWRLKANKQIIAEHKWDGTTVGGAAGIESLRLLDETKLRSTYSDFLGQPYFNEEEQVWYGDFWEYVVTRYFTKLGRLFNRYKAAKDTLFWQKMSAFDCLQNARLLTNSSASSTCDQ